MKPVRKPIDIRIPLKKAAVMVFSRPMFLVLGACIATPKLLLETLFSRSAYFQNFFKALESESSVPFFPELFIFLMLALLALVAGSFGVASLISFANHFESTGKTSLSELRSGLFQKTSHVFRLEVTLIALALIVGVILAIPSMVAHSQGLENLAHTLSLSALGLTLSIALLLFFLRQYAALYLSLSKISLRAALENASHLFRTHLRETVSMGAALLSVEIFLILLLILVEALASAIFEVFFSPNIAHDIFFWTMNLLVFSLFNAWNWTTWTLFFRMIALPKEPEPVLQKSETVLQQESAVSLDKA
jgi:hypothetical protein